MSKKAAKTKAKSVDLNPVPTAPRRPGRPRKVAYEVRPQPARGNLGRLGVVEVTSRGERIIARYHTPETAAWVRQVMQDAAKA